MLVAKPSCLSLLSGIHWISCDPFLLIGYCTHSLQYGKSQLTRSAEEAYELITQLTQRNKKKFNSPEFWWSILAVFFMLKTIPLTVFCYHLILLLFSSNFYVIKMDTWIKLIVVPFDYIETSIVQYSRIQGDSKKRSTALFSAWKIQ